MKKLRNENVRERFFAIKRKSDGMFWFSGSKVAWATKGAAKNAFNLHSGVKGSWELGYKDKVYFDDQDIYEIVEIKAEEI